MKAIITNAILLVVVATVFGVEEQWIDYRLVSHRAFLRQVREEDPTTTESPPTKPPTKPELPKCAVAGKTCDETCKNIWVCSMKNGVLSPSLIDTCKADQTCNNGVCSSVATPECSPAALKPFVCNEVGVFPDPATCKTYHFCTDIGSASVKKTCDKEYGYNAGTTYCSKKLVNNSCGADYPVPVCTQPGQNGALKDNKSIYFVCSLYENTGNVLYPYLYLCPHGLQYDGNYSCK